MTKLELTQIALNAYLYVETLQTGYIRSFTNYGDWASISIHYHFGDPQMFKAIKMIKGMLPANSQKKLKYYRKDGYLVYRIHINS